VRLFVAVWPSVEVMAEVGALPRPAVDGVRWTTPDQWHATLLFLGEVPDDPDLLIELEEALLRAAADHGPLEATVGPVTQLIGPQVLCIPVSGLERVATSVRRELVDVVDPPVGDVLADGRLRPFCGHLTLARARRGRRIPRRLVGLPMSAPWSVDRLSLVASRREAGGSRYDRLLQAPLGGRLRR
jgi:2'-5' RNA ligase